MRSLNKSRVSHTIFVLTQLGSSFVFSSVSIEQDEEWDSPFQWRETVSSQITTSLLPKEPPKIIAPYTSFNKPVQSGLHQQRLEKLIHVPYTRDPDEPMRRLSSIAIDSDYDRHERRYYPERESNYYKPSYPEDVRENVDFQPTVRYQQITYAERHNNSNNAYDFRQNIPSHNQTRKFNEPRENGYNSSPGKLNNCTKSANKDFEYIKPLNVNKRTQNSSKPTINPIAEMQSLARKSDNSDDNDDAPFNFQGILRKTNINRESLKRTTMDRTRNTSIKYAFHSVDDANSTNFNFNQKRGSLKKYKSMDLSKTEVAPGVYMEGRVIEL